MITRKEIEEEAEAEYGYLSAEVLSTVEFAWKMVQKALGANMEKEQPELPTEDEDKKEDEPKEEEDKD